MGATYWYVWYGVAFFKETLANRILSNTLPHVHGGGFERPPLLPDLSPCAFSYGNISRIKCSLPTFAQLMV
jgi:hypothetical protein